MTTRVPQLRLSLENELIIDQFAGGGGASLGIEMALGRSPDIAINHDPEAIAMHQVNHPTTEHYCESVWDVDPATVTKGRPVGLMWLSPDCTFHSKARGGKPFRDRSKARRRRGLAWVAVRWAKSVKPRVICLENVEEFKDWGPLTENDKPCPERRGMTFRRWVKQLENCGYIVEWRELRACDYGAPTIRKRLFLIARCDGMPIVWPQATHGAGLKPYRTAADCIDWSIPCPSIFERERPLAENTLKRIAAGIKRYVIDAAKPFIVPVTHAGGPGRVYSIDKPFNTVTAANRGESAFVAASIARIGQTGGGIQVQPADKPLSTVTTKAEHLLVGATMIQTGYGERKGQAPRALDLKKPIGTMVGSQKHALVSAFMAQHNGAKYGVNPGRPADAPMSTITTAGSNQQIVTSNLVKLRGTCKDGQRTDAPAPTITASGTHFAEVRAFLSAYYGTNQDAKLTDPMHTVTTKERFGLVTVNGMPYRIEDIGMRMLQPRELYRAQGFPEDYRIDITYGGKPLTKSAQVRMCGNSVAPPVAAAIVGANFNFDQIRLAA